MVQMYGDATGSADRKVPVMRSEHNGPVVIRATSLWTCLLVLPRRLEKT